MTIGGYENLPEFAPQQLNLHIIEGVSYNAAKRLAESYGVTVLPQDILWCQLSLLQVQIPHGENLDEWIAKLQSEIAFFRITKVGAYFLD